jgi:hypothetical protein
MKKLILAVAVVASSFSTFALTINPIESDITTVSSTEDFQEVALENVPTAIKEALAKDLASATLKKAYKNISEQYKLELSIDGSDNVVYADKDGNWLKITDVKITRSTEE